MVQTNSTSLSKHAIDLTNQQFGYLIVVGFDRKDEKQRCDYWFCRCKCGNVISVRASGLRNGGSKSCGCLRRENFISAITKHGLTTGSRKNPSRLLRIWKNMKQRCSNPKAQKYNNYGGRGIRVCEEWHNFENFHKWAVGNGYRDDLTIDRINNDGNYEPQNCRWATYSEQNMNRRVAI